MSDYELLGSFYLGREEGSDGALVLYDSRQLTTHGVIVGMTGSGKTGLGICLIEEAGMDRVPVIAIDPKGDLGNILLTFPDLAPSSFEPWVDPGAAERKGQSVSEYAATQAAHWQKGLAEWGQDGERIRQFRETVELGLYTPGSQTGIPIAVLASLHAPGADVLDDADVYGDTLQATVTSLLSLAGLETDPVTSREHILVARVIDAHWRAGRDLSLAGLIGAVQQPGFDKVGVIDLESFFPSKDRFALAMRLNNLLSAPGFESWMQGVPLDAAQLLFTASGKPRISVVSLSHLSDAERLFFVCMLLTEMIRWMRQQPGTGSLRAILYFDELFGFMPPVANPPSKPLLLTLLKQARAAGLGVVLATQNPVDLDYKGLSNAGTWFIGRLQTERDKARLLDGLQGAAGGLDRAQADRLITGLGHRGFVLHSVHESQPVVFSTRWAMSYLAGPLTREQIRRLTRESGSAAAAPSPGERARQPAMPQAGGAQAANATAPSGGGATAPALGVRPSAAHESAGSADAVRTPPVVPPGVSQLFFANAPGEELRPCVAAIADMVYSQQRLGIEERRRLVLLAPPPDGAIADIDWMAAREADFDPPALAERPPAEATFGTLPSPLADSRNHRAWERTLRSHLRSDRSLRLFQSPALKLVSRPGESEGEFRARLQLAAHERRDAEVEKLRKRYATRAQALQDRRRRAQQAVERRTEQARAQTVNAAVGFGTAILGTLLGNKRVSATNARSLGTAIRGGARARQQSQETGRATESLADVDAQIAALEEELREEIERHHLAYDAQAEQLEVIAVKPKASDVQVRALAIAWLPADMV